MDKSNREERGVHARQRANPLISIVVPVFNEQGSIAPFLDILLSILKSSGYRYEIVFVNDGSTDATLQRLREIQKTIGEIVIVNLSRNFGKDAALTAGIEHSAGDAVIPMDVDLQDPPDLILKFIEKWREGYDVVYGVRVDRSSDHPSKRITAGIFYRLFNLISDTKIPENAGDYRLLDRRVVDALSTLPERSRFMKGLFSWVGYRSIGIPYVRPDRECGDTKWSLWKLWNFALDAIVSFSTMPLKIWSYIGMVISMTAFVYASFIVLRVLVSGIDVPGYASIVTMVLFFGGVQLISLGVIGHYIGQLFLEVKGRPIYIIESIYRSDRRSETV